MSMIVPLISWWLLELDESEPLDLCVHGNSITAPLTKVNIMAPPTVTKVPIIFAWLRISFKFTFSILQNKFASLLLTNYYYDYYKSLPWKEHSLKNRNVMGPAESSSSSWNFYIQFIFFTNQIVLNINLCLRLFDIYVNRAFI